MYICFDTNLSTDFWVLEVLLGTSNYLCNQTIALMSTLGRTFSKI